MKAVQQLVLLCASALIIFNANADETNLVNFSKLYQSLASAKSVAVKAWGLSSCSYSTHQPEAIKQLADILKHAQIKPVTENLWFYGNTEYQDDRFANQGDSSAIFTLDDGREVALRFDRYYLNETTVDAVLILPKQQAMISANFHIHRDLTLWVQQHELPPETKFEKTQFTQKDIENMRGRPWTFPDNAAIEEHMRFVAEQDRDRYAGKLAECRWESKVKYYRTSPQQICGAYEFVPRPDPDYCGTGWELPNQENNKP